MLSSWSFPFSLVTGIRGAGQLRSPSVTVGRQHTLRGAVLFLIHHVGKSIWPVLGHVISAGHLSKYCVYNWLSAWTNLPSLQSRKCHQVRCKTTPSEACQKGTFAILLWVTIVSNFLFRSSVLRIRGNEPIVRRVFCVGWDTLGIYDFNKK